MSEEVREEMHLTLEGWGRFGEATARLDGQRVFVFGGIQGEEVVAEVLSRRRKFVFARVVEVLRPSPHRVAAPCPYFGPCTGCQWQHIEYSHQLELKRRIVEQALEEVGLASEGSVAPTLPSPQVWGYRNHARFTVGGEGHLGFVHRVTREFIPIGECMLMYPWINDALARLQGQCRETTQVSIRYGVNTGDWLIQPALCNPHVPLSSGQKFYQESLLGRGFRIAASSFFQVNTTQAERMAALVRDCLNLSGKEFLIDAYAGVGTLAILLSPFVSRVVAIEESASAVKDAQANTEGLSNIHFLQGKTEDILGQIEDSPDVVILDPPRTGCQQNALKALLNLAPRRVVYVSCDPSTLARDLGVLCQGSLSLEEVQPIDMFPHTHHIECVATLRFRGGKKRRSSQGAGIVLASQSPRRRELLSALSVPFKVVIPSQEEELMGEAGSPEEVAQGRALAKTRSVSRECPQDVVVGGDTIVVSEGRVLGKPRSEDEARDMLQCLKGGTHQVITAIAVAVPGMGQCLASHRVTQVTMRRYSGAEIEAYIRTGEAMDKAGAYAIQDPLFRPVETIEGCYSNVVGLPICTITELLQEAGVRVSVIDEAILERCSLCPLKRG